MMRVIRAIFSFILCLVLIGSLVATVSLMTVQQITSEETVDRILSGVSPGEKVFGYEKAADDRAITFEEALREELPLQTVQLANVYSDVARQATDAGIAGIVRYTGDESAVTEKNCSAMALAFTEEYIRYLSENGKLRGTVNYKNITGFRVWESKEKYARQVVLDRVEKDLKKIFEEGATFGKMTLDGQTPVFRTALSGKAASDAENEVYTALEGWYDNAYRSYLKGLLFYCLKEGQPEKVPLLSEEDVRDLFLSAAQKHGVKGPLLEDQKILDEIGSQARSYVLPAESPVLSVPYSSIVGNETEPALIWTRRVAAADPLIVGGAVCLLILLLMLLIGRRAGVFFAGFACLLTGAALWLSPMLQKKAHAEAASYIPLHLTENGILDSVIDLFISGIRVYGQYLIAAGGAFLLLWLLLLAISAVKKKIAGKKKEQT